MNGEKHACYILYTGSLLILQYVSEDLLAAKRKAITDGADKKSDGSNGKSDGARS